MQASLHLGDCMPGLLALPNECVAAIITDPPYGIDYQSNRVADKTKLRPKIQNDRAPFIWFLREAYRVLKHGGTIQVFCRWDVSDAFKSSLAWAGFTLKSEVIWDRGAHGMGDLKSAYAPRHDTILFATKGRFTFPARRPASVLHYLRVPADKLAHPNEKPLPLMKELITNVSMEGDVVCDPFLGSGSTAVAALLCGRDVIGWEIDVEHHNTAKKPLRASGGHCPICVGGGAPCNMTDPS